MRYSVERLIGGRWSVVADEIRTSQPDAADLAIGRTREGPGLYRVSSLGLPPRYYDVPGYGLARAVDPSAATAAAELLRAGGAAPRQ